MKCSFCNGDLSFPENVLKQLSVCPFCNEPYNYENSLQEQLSQPQSATEMLVAMVEKYGLDIFDESKLQKFYEELDTWSSKFFEERDVLKLLCIKNIPHILFVNRNASMNEQNLVISDCASTLNKSFSIEPSAARTMVSFVHTVIKNFITKTIVLEISPTSTYTDTRDGNTYKTVKIGDQIWFAENFRYDCEGSYAKDYAYMDEYGRLYNWEAAQKNAPPGWHLPTVEDLAKLKSYAKTTKNSPRFCWEYFCYCMDFLEKTGVWQKYKAFLKSIYFKSLDKYFLRDAEVKKHMNTAEYDTLLHSWYSFPEGNSFLNLKSKDAWLGTDTLGFCVKPAGCYAQGMRDIGIAAFFWLGDSKNEKSACSWRLNYDSLIENVVSKVKQFSVRYILNS